MRLSPSPSVMICEPSPPASQLLLTLTRSSPPSSCHHAGIPPLVDLIKRKTPAHGIDSYEDATKALWHLADSEDNQTAIAKAGGIAPLVALLSSESEVTAEYAAAALRSLARDHTENQMILARAGAIGPLAELLGSDSAATQVRQFFTSSSLLSLLSSRVRVDVQYVSRAPPSMPPRSFLHSYLSRR